MNVVIDAQMFAAFFQEEVLAIPVEQTQRTASVQPIFTRLGYEDCCHFDDGALIEHEWKQLVEVEWFVKWFSEQLRTGGILQIPVDTCQPLRRKLKQLGFPNSSKDFVYVRTAKKVVDDQGACLLATEDIDFYDPSKKKTASKHRDRLLKERGGPVAKQLRKEKITVCCATNYLDQCED
jgi:hypothetical protein